MVSWGMKWSVATDMLELSNISNVPFEVQSILAGDTSRLPAFFRQTGLDGIELNLYEDWNPADFPSDWIHGVHLRFWPNWLDFWCGDRDALCREFGSDRAWQESFGRTREEWLVQWHHHIRQAVRTGAEYVVFHVSQARTSEIYSRQYAYSDEDVIQAVLSLVNDIMADLPEGCQLLYENLWWPGLTFCQPALAAKLLAGTHHQNTGFMLDTGHLMNTCLELQDEQEAADYVCRTIAGLGDLRERIYGMHLHCSLSGVFVRQMKRQYAGRIGKPLSWQETFAYIARTDQHRPFRTQAARQIVELVQPRYLVHEFIQESWADWLQKVRLQRAALGWYEESRCSG